MADTSPTKWHRALTWFFETFVLAEHERSFTAFQDTYWFLFNSYYEALGPRFERPKRGIISRPGAHDVGVYRKNVDSRMQDLLDTLDEVSLTALEVTGPRACGTATPKPSGLDLSAVEGRPQVSPSRGVLGGRGRWTQAKHLPRLGHTQLVPMNESNQFTLCPGNRIILECNGLGGLVAWFAAVGRSFACVAFDVGRVVVVLGSAAASTRAAALRSRTRWPRASLDRSRSIFVHAWSILVRRWANAV